MRGKKKKVTNKWFKTKLLTQTHLLLMYSVGSMMFAFLFQLQNKKASIIRFSKKICIVLCAVYIFFFVLIIHIKTYGYHR